MAIKERMSKKVVSGIQTIALVYILKRKGERQGERNKEKERKKGGVIEGPCQSSGA